MKTCAQSYSQSICHWQVQEIDWINYGTYTQENYAAVKQSGLLCTDMEWFLGDIINEKSKMQNKKKAKFYVQNKGT